MRELDLQGNDRFVAERFGIQNAAAQAYSADTQTVSTATTNSGGSDLDYNTASIYGEVPVASALTVEAGASSNGSAETGILAANRSVGSVSQTTGEASVASTSNVNADSGGTDFGVEGGWDSVPVNADMGGNDFGINNAGSWDKDTGAQAAANLITAGYGEYGDYSSAVQSQGAGYQNDATDAAKAGNETFQANGITGYYWSGDSDGNLTLEKVNQNTGQGEPLATTNVGAEPGPSGSTAPTASTAEAGDTTTGVQAASIATTPVDTDAASAGASSGDAAAASAGASSGDAATASAGASSGDATTASAGASSGDAAAASAGASASTDNAAEAPTDGSLMADNTDTSDGTLSLSDSDSGMDGGFDSSSAVGMGGGDAPKLSMRRMPK